MSKKHGGAYAVALELQQRLRFSRGAAVGMRAALVIGLLVNFLIFGLLLLLSRNAFARQVIEWGALIDGIILAAAAIACGTRYRREARAETGAYVVQAPANIRKAVSEQVRIITGKLRSPLADLKIWLDRRNFHLSPTAILTKEGPGIIIPLGFVPLMRAKPDESSAILAHAIGHIRQRDGRLWTFVQCYWDTCMRVALPLVCTHLIFSLGLVALMTSGETVLTERAGAMESRQGQWLPLDSAQKALPHAPVGPAAAPAPTTVPAVPNAPATAPFPATQPSAQAISAPGEAIQAADSIPASPPPASEPAPFLIAAPPATEPAAAAAPGPAGADNPATAPSNDDEEDTSDTEEALPIPFWTGMIATALLCALAPVMLLTYYVGLCTQRRNSEALADLTAAASGNGRTLVHLLDPQADSGPPFVNRWPWLKMHPTNTWRYRRAKRALALINTGRTETAEDAFSMIDTPPWRALERATSYAMRLGIGQAIFAIFGLLLTTTLFELTKSSGQKFPAMYAALLVLAAIVPLAYVYLARSARRFDRSAMRMLALFSAGYLVALLLAAGSALLVLPSKAPAFIPSVYFAAALVLPFASLAAWCAIRAIPVAQHAAERLRKKEPAAPAKAAEAPELIASDVAKG